MHEHIKNMQRCIALAKIALKTGNAAVGAILVYKGNIIGEGIESGKTSGDITDHAEILAIRDSIRSGKRQFLEDALLYSTHEPCIMCSYAIRHYKISQIIYGVNVDHIGGHSSTFEVLGTAEVPQWGMRPEIIQGVCLAECLALNEQFELLQQKSTKDRRGV